MRRPLTPLQLRACAALQAEPTIERAAEVAGVSERQMRAWMRSEDFLEGYRRARIDVFSRSYWMAQRYAPAAVQTMAKIMLDEEVAAANRIAAAQAILRAAREGMDLDDEMTDEATRLALAS